MTQHPRNAVSQLLNTHRPLIRLALPPLQRLTRQTRLSAKISVRRGSSTITLACTSPDSAMFVAGSPGAKFHLAFGSSGSCLLAAMSDAQIQRLLNHAPQAVWNLQTPAEVWERIAEIRNFGFCVDPGQFHPDVRGLSAPLYDPAGNIAAAVTLMGFIHDLNNATIDKHAKSLLRVAGSLTVPPAKH